MSAATDDVVRAGGDGAPIPHAPLPVWPQALADTLDIDRVAHLVVDVDIPAVWPTLVGNTGFAAMLRESAPENIEWLREKLARRLDADVLARP